MQQGGSLRNATFGGLALVLLLCAFALALATSSASAATGGVTAPSGGSSTPSTGSGGSRPTGAVAPTGNTGGISPHSVRPPSAPVKRRKNRRKRRPPRTQQPATPAPAPAPATPTSGDIPGRFLTLYKAAGRSTGVDWRILAAIGKNESDHGRSTAPGVTSGLNFADCCAGPMQICTVTSCGKVWQHYAVDANGDGVASVYDPADSIHAAAALVKDLKTMVGTNPKLLLAAYNAGPGNVARYKGVPPFAETRAYVRAGLAYIASLR